MIIGGATSLLEHIVASFFESSRVRGFIMSFPYYTLYHYLFAKGDISKTKKYLSGNAIGQVAGLAGSIVGGLVVNLSLIHI